MFFEICSNGCSSPQFDVKHEFCTLSHKKRFHPHTKQGLPNECACLCLSALLSTLLSQNTRRKSGNAIKLHRHLLERKFLYKLSPPPLLLFPGRVRLTIMWPFAGGAARLLSVGARHASCTVAAIGKRHLPEIEARAPLLGASDH